MKIFFVNNQGGGYAETVEVSDGMSIESFFQRQLPGADPEKYSVRVNRNPIEAAVGFCGGVGVPGLARYRPGGALGGPPLREERHDTTDS